MSPHPWLHPAARSPAAAEDCPRCGGAGWFGEPFEPCACIRSCPKCAGSGFLAGGLELCACRIAADRVALLRAARLPTLLPEGPLPAGAQAWFDRVRPEDGWPWLTVAGPHAGAVVAAVARLITGVGVPTRVIPATMTPDETPLQRLVLCVGAEGLGSIKARRLLKRCADEGRILVLTCETPPLAVVGPGLEASLGEEVALTLWERGEVV
ncbi:MAG: hypothetical protein IPN01_12240 [Deltaproteobacteria bacterium]|nr:hypothetical protein [Deltaproteobacteria bacterium]